eukprot:2388937-Rhodomonas_salina.3
MARPSSSGLARCAPQTPTRTHNLVPEMAVSVRLRERRAFACVMCASARKAACGTDMTHGASSVFRAGFDE